MKSIFHYVFMILVLLSFSAILAQESETDQIRKLNQITRRLKEIQREGIGKAHLSQKFYNKLGVTESQLVKSYGRGKIHNNGTKAISYTDERNKAAFVYFFNYDGKVVKATGHLIAGPTEKDKTRKYLQAFEILANDGFKADSDGYFVRGKVKIKLKSEYASELGLWEIYMEAT